VKFALAMFGLMAISALGGLAYVEWSYLAVPKRGFSLTSDAEKAQFASDVRSAIGTNLPVMEGVDLATAWAAYESNWGKAAGYTKGNNPWNVTSGSHWTGATVSGPDTDDSSGATVPITQQWRVYPDIVSAFVDLSQLLQSGNSHYQEAYKALQVGDLSGLISNLHDGGYFTQNPSTYQLGVSSALTTLQALDSAGNSDGG
jgi:hypothetical protein